VSYSEKHNEANGEGNRDGDSHNLSMNFGIEGVTTDPAVLTLRHRQQRNFLATLFVSVGVPMLSGGDEFGRTQFGNNNGYCQDSPLSWTAWPPEAAEQDLLAFVQRLTALRASQPVLQRRTFLSGRRPGATDVLWLGPDGGELTSEAWNDHERRTLGMLLDGDAIFERDERGQLISGDTLLALLNASPADVPFMLPRRGASVWECLIDTAAPAAAVRPAKAGFPWLLVGQSVAVFRLAAGPAARVTAKRG